jgi:predicted ferric reductase
MTMLQKFTQRKTAYLPLGLFAAFAAVLLLTFGAGGRLLVEKLSREGAFAYAIASGFLLTAAMLWQWRLYLVRRSGEARRIQREYKLHRWLGILPMILLVAHMGKPNGSLLSIVSGLLLLSSLSGLLNNEIVRQKVRWARTLWLTLHIGSAALILPLIILHVWAAFAFKAV